MFSSPNVRARKENGFTDLNRCHLRTVGRGVDIGNNDKRWFRGIPYRIETEMMTEGKHEDRRENARV